MSSTKIKTILIANRSEIALRIQFTCHSLGIETIAIYTKEDKFASYVHKANKSYLLPQSGYTGYLDQEAIINIALKAKADAIHPGYGFLSENAQFAQKVIDAGLIWIGPTPQNISLFADKTKAYKVMLQANIPTIPGKAFKYNEINSFLHAKQFAIRNGFPVLLKSALGGGGKAMRHVDKLENFEQAWKTVASESQKQFNSQNILLEKDIPNARHIEIQIASDGKNYIHFYERECSIQRRHQKIIEETPCNAISKFTLQKLYNTALKAAKTVSYKNIGTIEFIVTPNEKFYFLEINTRLQVEHSVTELTTTMDLVSLQIYLAEHNKLPYNQKDIIKRGHAIECRIYSENPQNNFTPSTGKIISMQLPNGPFIRIDHDLEEETEITTFYDPMIMKLTTIGNTRNVAIKNMLNALQSTCIVGINTNIEFLKNILLSTEFKSGKIHTKLLQNKDYFNKLITLENKLENKNKLSKEEIGIIATLLSKQTESHKTNNNKQSKHTNKWSYRQWKQ